MTTISHHPDDSTLMAFAAGSLNEALSAVIATHLEVCPQCRKAARTLQALGGALLDGIATEPMAQDAPVMALRRLEADAAPRPRRPVAQGELPSSLAAALGTSLDAVHWRRLGPGVWHHRLPTRSGDLRLLKVAAGRRMPEHGHGGCELTMLLRGSYTDETGTYRRGDVADLDDSVEHTPVADAATGCICLIASEKPARFKGLLPRLVQPLTGM